MHHVHKDRCWRPKCNIHYRNVDQLWCTDPTLIDDRAIALDVATLHTKWVSVACWQTPALLTKAISGEPRFSPTAYIAAVVQGFLAKLASLRFHNAANVAGLWYRIIIETDGRTLERLSCLVLLIIPTERLIDRECWIPRFHNQIIDGVIKANIGWFIHYYLCFIVISSYFLFLNKL